MCLIQFSSYLSHLVLYATYLSLSHIKTIWSWTFKSYSFVLHATVNPPVREKSMLFNYFYSIGLELECYINIKVQYILLFEINQVFQLKDANPMSIFHLRDILHSADFFHFSSYTYPDSHTQIVKIKSRIMCF